MNATTPLWVDILTAAFLALGALAALVGSLGLLRFRSFFQRVHTPTLGATVGTWGFTLATVAQTSFVAGQPYVHALLIAVFVAFTAPVTTVLLMRAALFRGRLRGDASIPRLTEPPPRVPDEDG